MTAMLPGLLLVPACLLGLLVALSAYQRHCAPDPELVRKLLHIGIGVVCLAFPWLFDRMLPVLLLLLLSTVLMLALRTLPLLRRTLGAVLNRVGRASLGDLMFAPGVALTFWLAAGDPLLYILPVLLLTFADSAAALVGTHYGWMRYNTVGGTKSVEGSAAFWGVSFVCAQVVLLLAGGLPVLHVLVLAALLAVLLTLVENVSWGGLDNLLIPVMGCLLLKSLLHTDMVVLLVLLGTLVASASPLLLLAARRLQPVVE